MANNVVKGNDWVATMLSNPDQSINSLIDSGLNSYNTVMASKDDYRGTKKIQELFTDKNGKFNEKDFEKFYDQANDSYNQLSIESFNNETTVQRSFYENQMGAPKDVQKRSLIGRFEKVQNPMKNIIGMQGINVVSPNDKSVREIAQENFVRDSKTGKSLGWKPNDDNRSGFFDFIFNTDPTVLAQWDSDGEHIDPFSKRKIKHQKGEQKTDENGDFYYETLGNREAFNKQFLTMQDTFTDDGSFANKFDFMDSDGLTKSITGTVMKTAASIVPYFIPKVKYLYPILTTAIEAADALPSLVKSIAGFTGNDLSKNERLNSIQGQVRRLKANTGVSDMSQQKAFSFENMMNIVSSTVDQLYSQRLVAQIPGMLGSSNKQIGKYMKELDTLSKIEGNKKFVDMAEDAQKGILAKYAKTSKTIADLQKKQEFWNTTAATNLSSLYMAATSSTQAYEDAKRQGLNQQDASRYYTGVFAGMFLLMRYTKIGHWALKGLGTDDVSKALNSAIKTEGKGVLQNLKKANSAYAEDILQNAPKKAGNKLLNVFNAGLDLGKKAGNILIKGDIDTLLKASAAEGIEEMSEELMQDTLKNVYNGLNSIGATKTKKGNQFQFTADDIMKRYAMSFIGGAVGGAIFKGSDALMNKMTGHISPEVNKTLMWYVANGQAEKALSIVQKQEDNGEYGSTTLTPNAIYSTNYDFDHQNFEPTNDKTKSQNAFIANILRAKINQLQTVVNQYDIPSQIALGKDYSDRVNRIIDIKLNSSLSEDVEKLSNDIYENVAEIRALERPTNDSSEADVKSFHEQEKKYQDRIKDAREELKAISKGDRLQKYFEEAFFSTRPFLYNQFDVKTPNDFAETHYNKKYVELNDEEKDKIDSIYENYASFSKLDHLKLGKKQFDQYKEFILKNKENLSSYIGNKIVGLDEEAIEEYKETFKQAKEPEANFLDLVNNYNEQLSLGINPTQTPFSIDLKALDNAVDEQFEKDNQGHLKNIKFLRDLNKTYLIQKYKGQTDILSEQDISGLKDNIKVGSLVSKTNVMAFNDFVKKADINKKFIELNQQDIDSWAQNGVDPGIIKQLQESFDNRDEIINEANKITNKLSEDKNKPSNLLNILKNISLTTAEKDENDVLFNVFDILDTQRKKMNNPSFDLGSFVINSKLNEDQIDKSIDTINKVAATIYSMSDIKGYGNETFITAVNDILKRNNIKSEYEGKNFTQVESNKLLNELYYYKNQLEFMKTVSKQNKGNKIRYDKVASNTYKSKNILSFIPNDNFVFNSLYDDVFKNFDGKEDFFDSDEIKLEIDKFNSLLLQNNIEDYDDFSLSLSDEDIILLNETSFNIEKFIHDKINSSPDGKQKLLDRIKQSFTQKTDPEDIRNSILSDIERAEQNPTKYNPKVEYYKKLDSVNHLLAIVSLDPKLMNSYIIGSTDANGETDFEKTPYAPLQSQEDAIRYTVSHVMSQNDEFNIIKEFYSFLDKNHFDNSKIDANRKDSFQYIFSNATTIEGYPGTGKSTILNTISRILENGNKKIMAYAPYDEKGKELIDSLGNRDNIVKTKSNNISDFTRNIIGDELYSELITAMKEKTWSEFNMNDVKSFPKETDSPLIKVVGYDDNGKPSGYIFKINESHPGIKKALDNIKNDIGADVLIIDEYTHVNPVDFSILQSFEKAYNSRQEKSINYIFVGDSLQDGFTMDIQKGGDNEELMPSSVISYKTPLLTDMLRAGYNNKIDDIISVRSLLQNVIDNIDDLSKSYSLIKDTQIKFSYSESDEEGLIGNKIVDKINIEDLILLSKDGVVGVVVDSKNDPIVKLIETLPAIDQKNFDIRIQSRVQGGEFINVVIATHEPPIKKDEKYSGRNALKSLYTYISRSKKGSLILRDSIADGLNVSSIRGNDNSKAEFNQQQVEDYKKLRFDILKGSYDTEMLKAIKPSTSKIITETSGVKTMQKWNDDMLVSLYEQASDPSIYKPDQIFDSEKPGSPSEFGKDKMYMYPFHERKNHSMIKIENNDTVVYDYENPTDDIALMFSNSVGDPKDFVDSILKNGEKEVLDEYKQDFKIIKTAILNKILYHKDESLMDLIPKYILSKYSNIDFDSFDTVIESRELNKYNYDLHIDQSSVYKGKQKFDKSKVNLIHFLDLRLKTKDGKNLFFTISSFPNINNPDVQKQPHVLKFIQESLNMINGNPVEGVLFRNLGDESKVNDISKLTRIKFAPYEKAITLEQFEKENKHIVYSEPMIITKEYDFLEDSEESESGKIKSSLKGKPAMFVSFDQTLKPYELEQEYINQLKEYNEGTRTDFSVNIAFITTRQLPFSEWIQQYHDYKKQPDSAMKNSYENHFMAAKLLTNMITQANYYKYLFDQQKNGKISAEQKIRLDKFINGEDSLSKDLVNQIIERTNSLFPEINTYLIDINKQKEKGDRESSRQRTLNYVIGKIQESYSSTDLNKSSLAEYLKGVIGEPEVKRMFTDINNAKSFKYTSIIHSILYNKTTSPNEITDSGKFITTNLASQLNTLISYGDQFKNGMVYIHPTIEKSTSSSVEVPYMCKMANKKSDIIINKEILPPNIYINMSGLSNVDINEDDLKRQKNVEQNKVLINEQLKNIPFNINDMNLNYNKPINQIYKDVINYLNKQSLLMSNNDIFFNFRMTDNHIDFDIIYLDNNQDLRFNIDGARFIYPDDILSIKTEGDNIIAIKENGNELVIDKTGNIVQERISKESTDITENNKILTIFASKIKSLADDASITNEIKQSVQIEALNHVNEKTDIFIDSINKILSENNLDHRFRMVQANDGEIRFEETKLNLPQAGQEVKKPVIEVTVVKKQEIPILDRASSLKQFNDVLINSSIDNTFIKSISDLFNESNPSLKSNLQLVSNILFDKDNIEMIKNLDINNKELLFNALTTLFNNLKC